jgi:hypothetical protein
MYTIETNRLLAELFNQRHPALWSPLTLSDILKCAEKRSPSRCRNDSQR